MQQERHIPVQEGGRGTQFILQQEQHVPVQGGAFDDTLTSGFEDTKSDLHYHSDPRDTDNHGDGSVDNERYELQDAEGHISHMQSDLHQRLPRHDHASKQFEQHGLQHKQSRSPLVNRDPEQQQNPYVGQPTPAISGRFQKGRDEHWQLDIAHRGGTLPGQQVSTPYQRGHPNEPEDDDEDQDEYNQLQGMGQQDSDDYGDNESGEDADLPTMQEGGNGHHARQKSGDKGFNPRSEGAETAVSAISRRPSRRDEIERALAARLQDPDRSKLDYDDEKLKSMTYKDLKKETWDPKISSQKRANPAGTQNSEFSFEDCIEYTVKHESAENQVQFFEDMPMTEFEDAGDFFIDKFVDLMQKIKEARKKKRELVTAFETEIEIREKAVRGKSETFDKKFKDMRAGGEGVLRGKV